MKRILLMAAALTLFGLAGSAAQDAPMTLKGTMSQGGLIRGQTVPRARVFLDGVQLPVTRNGAFVFGFGRDQKPTAELALILPSGERYVRDLAIAQREYDVQSITDLDQAKVTPSPEDLARIAEESELKRKARYRDNEGYWFDEDFVWPVKGPISGVYGSQRILNGEPRQPHFGVDIAAAEGTPVLAPAGGVVTLAEPDLFFEGSTVFLDHSHGVISAFLHMSGLAVKVGDVLKQGDEIGKVGASGRVTGAHLDWRIYWGEEHIDPALVVAEAMPEGAVAPAAEVESEPLNPPEPLPTP